MWILLQSKSGFVRKNSAAIIVYALVCGLALSWLVIQTIIPMLTTPVTISLNLSVDAANLSSIVNLFFQILISVLILFSIIHNGLDLVKKASTGDTNYAKEMPKVRRFDLNQRIQHIWFLTTTFVLALTGFALLYYPAWGIYVAQMVGGEPNLMSIHLATAFLMGVLIVYHFAFYGAQYLIGRARGQPVRLNMIMGKKDIGDFLQSMRYMLGRGQPPRYPKYDYTQKFDYWGIYWGMIILGVPGLLLWVYGYDFLYEVPFVFHTDEAILAVLFIMVFHFYQTHFNPRYFPLNKVFLTGKMSEKDMQKEHPLELERIKSQVPEKGITVGEK